MRLSKLRLELISVLLVLACGHPPPPPPPAPAQPPPPPPGPTWSSADIDTIGEILRLEDRREYDAVRFTGWLQAPADEVRRRAALAVGRIGDRSSTPLLLNALADPSPRVRRDAAFALGLLRDSSSTVINALGRVAQGADSAAAEAVAALGRMVSGYPIVEARAADPNTAPEVRREALVALARYRRTPAMLRIIVPHTGSLDLETRWRAVYALTRGPSDPGAVPYLQRLLTDPEPLVRSLAARGLRAGTADTANLREPTVALLRSLLTDPDAQVRINAVRSLGTYRDTANIALMVAMLAEGDGNVVIAALESLVANGGGLGDIENVARATDRPIGIRNAALIALTRVAPDKAVVLANEWLATPDWLNRLFGLRAMIATRTLIGAAAARQAVQDKDPRVAAAALQFIATNDTLSPPYTLFIEKLADRDPAVRAAALRGLQRRASPSDLEPLLRAYERAQQDTVTDAAMAAVDALGELARQDVPVERSFFLRFHKPVDPLLHRRVIERIGPGPWGQARPIDTKKPPEYYRAVAHHYLHPDSTRVTARVRIETAGGQIIMALNPQQAPLTVLNFLSLAERGYFDGGRWHRVVPNFVLQDGDPRGDGEGGPGYVIRDEINRLRYTRGAVGMALSGPDTGGSQFFITHSPQPHLDGGYTIFGYVVSGIGVADRIIQDDPIVRIGVIE